VGAYKIKDDTQIRGINTPEDLEFARRLLGKAD
jgi:GTP:adenosylcobinamide-phosphate guanylyltransferase